MISGWTACGGLRRQEGTQLLRALSSQLLQASQRHGLSFPVGEKRMLAGPTSHMAARSSGLMRPPEVGPVQPQRSSPRWLVPGLQQTMDFCHR
jgi:hypothetical protein